MIFSGTAQFEALGYAFTNPLTSNQDMLITPMMDYVRVPEVGRVDKNFSSKSTVSE